MVGTPKFCIKNCPPWHSKDHLSLASKSPHLAPKFRFSISGTGARRPAIPVLMGVLHYNPLDGELGFRLSCFVWGGVAHCRGDGQKEPDQGKEVVEAKADALRFEMAAVVELCVKGSLRILGPFVRAACFTEVLSFLFVVLFGWGAPLEEVPRARTEK